VTFGERLRQLRTAAGWSQSELARRAKVHRPIISHVEGGTQKSMSIENARKLAAALGVTLDVFVGGEEGRTPSENT
jgi:transcriptional regulator with XRE-family HTH domain